MAPLPALRVGIDIGGTNVRIGLIEGSRVAGFESFRLKRDQSLAALCRDIARRIRRAVRRWEGRGRTVLRTAGISAPGAYWDDGRVFPGTVPNIPALRRGRLYEEIARQLGKEWRITPRHVNNDGVLQGLLLAETYLRRRPRRTGKIISLVPGTGFGAGVYHLDEGQIRPAAGPQQLFDVVVGRARRGQWIADPSRREGGRAAKGGEPLIVENLATGRALELIGRHRLGRSVTGGELSRLALHGEGGEREAARDIFKDAGSALAQLVIRLHRGRYQKILVPFKPKTRGVDTVIIGGNWLVQGAGRALALRQMRRILRQRGYSRIRLITSDRILPINRSDHLGVLAAALLVDI